MILTIIFSMIYLRWHSIKLRISEKKNKPLVAQLMNICRPLKDKAVPHVFVNHITEDKKKILTFIPT